MQGFRLPVLAAVAAAGLAAAPALSQTSAQTLAAPDWSTAQTVEIDLTNFAFSPAKLELKPGVVYRLHFVNKTSGGHDFTAKDFFADATVDPEDQGVVKDGMVMLTGNESADVRLTPKAGRYAAKCTHLMHATLGMKGEVLVQ